MSKNIIKRTVLGFILAFPFVKSVSQTSINFTYDSGGNVVQRSVQVMVNPRLINPNLNNSTSADSLPTVALKVYPNPTKDFVYVEGDLPKDVESAQMFLFNNTGQTLRTDAYDGKLKTVPVSDLKPGIYYLEFKASKRTLTTYKILITN
jgi:hypothetical protein